VIIIGRVVGRTKFLKKERMIDALCGEDKVFEEGKNELSASKVEIKHSSQDNTTIDNPTSSGAKHKATSINAVLTLLLYFIQRKEQSTSGKWFISGLHK
jgi:hypothetical protein